MARKARDFEGDVIAFCGVWFMAETAKILNPERTVVVPDAEAGCSLVDCCPAEQLRAYRERYPDHVIVSYINTSAEVKAESDILCTSRNAVDVVNSIPRDRTVLFVPDRNLGNYVKRQTGRENMKVWQGACIVHATFSGRRVAAAQQPSSPMPWWPPTRKVPRTPWRWRTSSAPPRRSSSGASSIRAGRFIVVTESGVNFSLERMAPEKQFHYIHNEQCNCSECPHMKRNTLEKLRDCLSSTRAPGRTARRAS